MDFSDFDNDRKIWEDGTRLIRRDCQPFLKQVSFPFSLYRGMFGSTHKFVKKQVRLEDRRPSEMDQRDHETLNKHFTQTFGAPFRNAMFASGDEDSSGYFGSLYSVFPIGPFEYLWSWEIDDLNFQMHDLLNDFYVKHAREQIMPPTPAQRAEGVTMAISEVDYQTDELEKGINSGNEIMIRCKAYYALPIQMIDKTGMLTPLLDILDQVP